MKNNKVVKLIVIACVLILIILIGITISLMKENKEVLSNEKNIVKETAAAVEDCSYNDDKEAYNSAIKNATTLTCSCIEEEALRVTCKDVVYELGLYNQALAQGNPEICNDIKEVSRKEACITTAQSKVDYLKAEDPQALANMQALAHSENAIGTLEKLVEGDSENIDNLIQLALSYAEKGLNEQEQGREREEYIQKAFDIIVRAKEINQKDSNVYRAEGYIYEIKPDISMAIESYNKAIELDNKNIKAYTGRGHAHRIMGVLDLAIKDFQEAAKIDKNNETIAIYTNLCNLENSRGNIEIAIKNCNIVVNTKNADPVFTSGAYQVLGQMYTQKKEYTKASDNLIQAKVLTPKDANLFIAMAKLNIYQEQYDNATRNARMAVELAVKKAAAYLILSQTLYMQEEYENAINVAKQGEILVDSDVSLLFSSKNAVKRDLYYAISNNYRELGDIQMQNEYEKKAENLDNN